MHVHIFFLLAVHCLFVFFSQNSAHVLNTPPYEDEHSLKPTANANDVLMNHPHMSRDEDGIIHSAAVKNGNAESLVPSQLDTDNKNENEDGQHSEVQRHRRNPQSSSDINNTIYYFSEHYKNPIKNFFFTSTKIDIARILFYIEHCFIKEGRVSKVHDKSLTCRVNIPYENDPNQFFTVCCRNVVKNRGVASQFYNWAKELCSGVLSYLRPKIYDSIEKSHKSLNKSHEPTCKPGDYECAYDKLYRSAIKHLRSAAFKFVGNLCNFF